MPISPNLQAEPVPAILFDKYHIDKTFDQFMTGDTGWTGNYLSCHWQNLAVAGNDCMHPTGIR
jgi:hypothetical protein